MRKLVQSCIIITLINYEGKEKMRTLLLEVIDIHGGRMKHFTIMDNFIRHSNSSLMHVECWVFWGNMTSEAIAKVG
jgi:hypothetical protein